MRRTSCIALVLLGAAARADTLDDIVNAEIQKRNVPGLSLAIIQDGKIVKAKGYGLVEAGGQKPVTTATLFQAGSISKSVAALGALRLVEGGKLELDQDVNARLKTWKVPDSELLRQKKVTLRGILSHTAGMTVHGFPGYAAGGPVATLVQVLDGAPPANTEPIRVDTEPGTKWRYSGGGYTVMQALMIDVSGKAFPALMQSLVLGPAEMTQSSYEQPLPQSRAQATATGHSNKHRPVEGRWHIYPEMAAAGLWTTPSDLARFAILVQRALAGKSTKVVSRAMARQMITEEKDGDGLGVFLQGKGRTLRFSHNGRDEGFDALLVATAETGQGVVIMINANDNSRMVQRIANAVAREYRWPEDQPAPPERPVATVDAATLARNAGRYEIRNNDLWTVVVRDRRLYLMSDGLLDDELVPAAGDRFHTIDDALDLSFVVENGAVTGCSWRSPDKSGIAPRVGPLAEGLPERADPDSKLTAKIQSALQALATGVKESPGRAFWSLGALHDFTNPMADLGRIQSLSFLDAQEIAGRSVERHGGKVSRVLTYAIKPAGKPRYVLVYLTAEGQLTDLDLVDE